MADDTGKEPSAFLAGLQHLETLDRTLDDTTNTLSALTLRLERLSQQQAQHVAASDCLITRTLNDTLEQIHNIAVEAPRSAQEASKALRRMVPHLLGFGGLCGLLCAWWEDGGSATMRELSKHSPSRATRQSNPLRRFKGWNGRTFSRPILPVTDVIPDKGKDYRKGYLFFILS